MDINELFPDPPVKHSCPDCGHVYFHAHKRGIHAGLCKCMIGILNPSSVLAVSDDNGAIRL